MLKKAHLIQGKSAAILAEVWLKCKYHRKTSNIIGEKTELDWQSHYIVLLYLHRCVLHNYGIGEKLL